MHRKKYELYFTHLPRSPRGRICTKFGLGSHVPDVITSIQLWRIFWQSVKGFRFYRGSNFGSLHWLRQSPLIQCCATARLCWLSLCLWYRYSDRGWKCCSILVTHGEPIFCSSTVAYTSIRMSSLCDLSAKSCALTTSSSPMTLQAGIGLFQPLSTTGSWFPSPEHDSGRSGWWCIFSLSVLSVSD